MEWKEQYKHPQWQKKRLEVLESAGFCCQWCGSKDTTLHVHHRRYIKGRKIWDYQNGNFDVLCKDCHDDVHEEKELFGSVIEKIGAGRMRDAAALLAGWLSEGEVFAPERFEPDWFYAGRLATYLQNFAVPSKLADSITTIRPDMFESAIRSLLDEGSD